MIHSSHKIQHQIIATIASIRRTSTKKPGTQYLVLQRE
jgi:hypothetical protein